MATKLPKQEMLDLVERQAAEGPQEQAAGG
jgi:hypothetical protein